MNWLTYHRKERAKTHRNDGQMLSLHILASSPLWFHYFESLKTLKLVQTLTDRMQKGFFQVLFFHYCTHQSNLEVWIKIHV